MKWQLFNVDNHVDSVTYQLEYHEARYTIYKVQVTRPSLGTSIIGRGARGGVYKMEGVGQNIVLRPRDALLQSNVHQVLLLQHLRTTLFCIRTRVGLIHASYHLFWYPREEARRPKIGAGETKTDTSGTRNVVTKS